MISTSTYETYSYTYDGMGRRLTETSGTDEIETTYKYYYLCGQKTIMDIDQITTTTGTMLLHAGLGLISKTEQNPREYPGVFRFRIKCGMT